jgi:ABC-type dipeptide/oligopeptide/nickel transport system permease subunit/ABC-type transport system substrate-binding protein
MPAERSAGHRAFAAHPVLARFWRDRSARLGAILLCAIVLFAIVGPLIIPYDPTISDFTMRRDPIGGPPGPSLSHPLGTDGLFRDLLARLASGARLSLGVASMATALAVSLGTCVGVAAGLAEGGPAWIVDSALMRLVDALLALPFLLFVTAIGAAVGRPDAGTMLLVLGLTGWTGVARIVRDRTREIRRRDFVIAARALGGSTPHVVQRHILPNLQGTLLVVATLSIGQMILAEAVLSYLTLGTQPPAPSWGRMLHEAEPLLRTQLLKVAAPGFAILLTVLATSRVAEGLRDAFEPRGTAWSSSTMGAALGPAELRPHTLRTGRRVPFDLAMAAAVLLLVALAKPPQLGAPTGVARREAAPQRGGTLRMALTVGLRTLDPALAYDEATTPLVALLFHRLVTWDAEGRVAADLAERFEVSEDGRTYTFTLRQNVRFHDGAELTAADVTRSLERALHPKTPCPGASYYESIRGFEEFRSGKAGHLAGARAQGPHTVVFELTEPDATFLPLLTLGFAAPVCPSMGARVDTQSPALPCGTGPFRLASFEPESALRLVRHEGYHVPGRPYLDAIEWITNVPAHAQRYRFEDGALDMLRELSSADSARFSSDARWAGQYAWIAKKATNGFFMNTEMAPFDSVAVRRAVAFAVDPSVLMKVRVDIEETDRILPASVPGPARSRRMRVHDVGRALEEMAKAGFAFDPKTGKGGYPHAVDYVTVPDSFQQQEAEVYAQQLARIGLRVRLKLMPATSYLAEVSRRKTSPMGWRGWNADFPDPSNFFEPTLSSKAIQDEGSQNVSFFADSEMDRVIAQAHRERSSAARMALFERAEEIVRDQAPWVPATVPRGLEVWQPYVHGYAPHPFLPAQLGEVWIDAAGRSPQASAPSGPAFGALPARAAGARRPP